MSTFQRRQPAHTLAGLAFIALVSSIVPLALTQTSNPERALASDVVENGCFRVDKSWRFCGRWDGAYIDINNYPANFTFQDRPSIANTASALSIFWAGARTGEIGKTFNDRFAQWVRGNPPTVSAGSRSVATYPSFMMQSMGCSAYSGHQRQYLVSMTCMQLVEGASSTCKAISRNKGYEPMGVCKSVCESSTASINAMFTNTTMCPGSNNARALHVASFRNLCDRVPAFSGTKADSSCYDASEIETDNCGYQERGPICNPQTCPAGPNTEFCKGASNSGSGTGSGLPVADPNAANPGSEANKQGATEESGSGLSTIAITVIAIGAVLVIGAIGGLMFVRRRRSAAAAASKSNRPDSRDSWPPQKPVMTSLDSVPRNATAPAAASGGASGKAPLSPHSFDNQPGSQGPPGNQMQNMSPQHQQYQQPTSPVFGNNAPPSPYAPQQQQSQHPYGPPGSNPGPAVGMNQPGYPPQPTQQYGNMPGSNPGSAVGMTAQGYPQQQPQQQQQFDRGMPAPAMSPAYVEQQQQQTSPKANKRISSMMVVQQHQEATLGRDGEFGNGTMTEDDFMAEFEGEQYKASRNYDPGMSDEMELVVGDMISVTSKYDDGWAYGLNLSTGQLGVFPLNFAEPVGDERANPHAVPTRQSMYGNSDRLSQYRKSVKLDVMIDDAPLDVDFSKGSGSSVGVKEQHQQQQQREQEADPRQTAVPADPSSISALMAVLEKISADERGGEIAPELKDKKKRETIEFKVAKLPPDVRDSIVSSATNDHHNSRFSFSALMSVLDDPQLQHHQSVYLDKKAGSRDTLYSTYTYYEEMSNAGSGSPHGTPNQPPLPPQGYSSGYAHHQGGQHATQRPLSTLSDLDRWDQRLEHDSEEMNRELSKLRHHDGQHQQGNKPQSPRH